MTKPKRIETREELRQRTRREVAEEIAAALEERTEIRDTLVWLSAASNGAAHIAREIGARS